MTNATKDMLALARLHGATVYTHRTMPDNPAVAFGNIAQLAAFTEAVRSQAAPTGWPGKSHEADFDTNTWTFMMEPGFQVTAGLYRIVPIRGDFRQKSSTHAACEAGPTGDDSVLVPREPTLEMIAAGQAHTERDDEEFEPGDRQNYRARGQALAVFSDMIKAAPQPPTGHPGHQQEPNIHAGSAPVEGVLGSSTWPGIKPTRGGTTQVDDTAQSVEGIIRAVVDSYASGYDNPLSVPCRSVAFEMRSNMLPTLLCELAVQAAAACLSDSAKSEPQADLPLTGEPQAAQVPYSGFDPVVWTPADEARLDKAITDHYGRPAAPAGKADGLEQILRCRYPVCTSIHPSGYGWDTSRLNEVISDLGADSPDYLPTVQTNGGSE